jgi:hypothetical protein
VTPRRAGLEKRLEVDHGLRAGEQSVSQERLRAILLLSLTALLPACGGDEDAKTEPPAGEPAPAEPAPREARAAAGAPADLPRGLLLAFAQFPVENGQVSATPGAARAEIVYRRGGEWKVEGFEDAASNVFHKVMLYTPPGGAPGLLTLGGNAAAVKLWRRGGDGAFTAETLWTEQFGGTQNRMRDAEIADLYGDGRPAVAVATHDQGVVAVLRPDAAGAMSVVQLDRQPNTFVHEIEIGDLNGDGALEVYATPSEPNRVGADAQSGHVVRYVPKSGEGRVVVAELGDRHAKEIYVGDVDGDGRDELYVAVEALTRGSGSSLEVVEPVEIRRYDQGTPPDQGRVVATLQDRFCRFLTVGDVDGDGRREMVAAAYRSGVWLLKPGRDPQAAWTTESIDRDSSGFEHSALLADLDGDHRDELYVAADDQGELRRFVFANGRFEREVILRRDQPRQRMTWNIMAAPIEGLVPAR